MTADLSRKCVWKVEGKIVTAFSSNFVRPILSKYKGVNRGQCCITMYTDYGFRRNRSTKDRSRSLFNRYWTIDLDRRTLGSRSTYLGIVIEGHGSRIEQSEMRTEWSRRPYRRHNLPEIITEGLHRPCRSEICTKLVLKWIRKHYKWVNC